MEGDVERAMYLYAHSLEWHPTAEAYTFMGWAYSFQLKFEKAIEQCQKAIQIDPDFGNPYNDIGAYYIEMGRDDEAIPYLEKAVLARRYANRHFPFYNLGRVQEKRREWASALRSYQKALELSPEFEAARVAVERVKGNLP